MISDNEIEMIAEQFIDVQEQWQRDRYYHGMNVIAFAKRIAEKTETLVIKREINHLSSQSRLIERLTYTLLRVIGEHTAPADCYSSGPFYGDASDDVCPSCHALRLAGDMKRILELHEKRMAQIQNSQIAETGKENS